MFYNNVQELCKENKTNITRMAKEIGLSNAAAASWRKGSIPKGETLQKVADYFNVSIDYLLSDPNPRTVMAKASSVILNGTGHTSAAGNAKITTGTGTVSETETLSEMEKELLRIFRKMDMRKKNCIMSQFYELEDQMKEV